MVNGVDYRVSNRADSVKEFFKNALAPYGTTMVFVEISPGVIINTANIVDIQEVVEIEESEKEPDLESNISPELLEKLDGMANGDLESEVLDVESEDIDEGTASVESMGV